MDRYEKVKELGRGAFGLAVLCREKRPCGAQACGEDAPLRVIKQIDLAGMKPDAMRESLNEIEVLRKFSHPQIVHSQDAFLEGRTLHIVMEYLDGGDLAATIRKHKDEAFPFLEDDALSIFMQCLLALQHIHKQNVLHRDIKPPNIFMTLDGGVKLGDFGIAKVLQHTMVQANTTIGTPSYFAPEVCQSVPYGSKADVWSVGVVLYEILALRQPFQAQNIAALVLKIVTAPPDPLADSYNKDLQDIVMRTLNKNPEERPSAQRLLNEELLRHRGLDLLGKHLRPYTGARLSTGGSRLSTGVSRLGTGASRSGTGAGRARTGPRLPTAPRRQCGSAPAAAGAKAVEEHLPEPASQTGAMDSVDILVLSHRPGSATDMAEELRQNREMARRAKEKAMGRQMGSSIFLEQAPPPHASPGAARGQVKMVTLQKKSKLEELGLSLEKDDSESTLTILSVAPGSVAEMHNRHSHARQHVSVGDCIIEVNGARGSAAGMLHELSRKTVLDLVLRCPAPRFRAASSPPDPVLAQVVESPGHSPPASADPRSPSRPAPAARSSSVHAQPHAESQDWQQSTLARTGGLIARVPNQHAVGSPTPGGASHGASSSGSRPCSRPLSRPTSQGTTASLSLPTAGATRGGRFQRAPSGGPGRARAERLPSGAGAHGHHKGGAASEGGAYPSAVQHGGPSWHAPAWALHLANAPLDRPVFSHEEGQDRQDDLGQLREAIARLADDGVSEKKKAVSRKGSQNTTSGAGRGTGKSRGGEATLQAGATRTRGVALESPSSSTTAEVTADPGKACDLGDDLTDTWSGAVLMAAPAGAALPDASCGARTLEQLVAQG